MRPFSRRATLSALAIIALAACGSATGDDTEPSATSITGLPDMILGDVDAPVTLIEYASVTCPSCAQFHATVMPTIKADYVETGKVRFIFREFPTPPANVSIAGFAIARCAGADTYFDVLDDLFDAQPGILAAARTGTVRPALQAIAERNGITGDEAFEACITDRAIREDIADVIISGDEYQVASTPTLILQGSKLENNMASRTPAGLSALIDAELAALGIEVSTPEPVVEDVPAPVEDAPVDGETETAGEH